MARPENWNNQGYVPTPEEIIPLLMKHLYLRCHAHSTYSPEPGHLDILDPCAGEGTAVTQLADAISVEFGEHCIDSYRRSLPAIEYQHRIRTWGIEVNSERHKEAAKKMHTVFHGDFLADYVCRAGLFNIAWVNPPYDNMGDGTGRVETRFLTRAIEALIPGGLLLYVVPEKVADGDIAIIFQSCVRPMKLRFPSDLYDAYQQVIVVAEKRHDPVGWNYAESSAYWQCETALGGIPGRKEVPYNAEYSSRFYTEQLALHTGMIRKIDINLDDLEEEVLTSGTIAGTKMRQAMDPEGSIVYSPPLMPLRKGHIIIQVANGQLNNAVLEDPENIKAPIIVRGTARKVQEEEHRAEDDNGELRELVTKDRISTLLQCMNLETGVIEILDESSGTALSEFLMENWPAMEQYTREMFPPAIDPTAQEWRDIREFTRNVVRPPISFQHPVIVTLAAAMRLRKSNYLIGEQGTGKTYISMVAAVAAGCRKILVTTPSHAIETWLEEITMTFPDALIRVVKGIGDATQPLTTHEQSGTYAEMPMARIVQMEVQNDNPIFVLLSKTKASLGGPVTYSKRMVGMNADDAKLFRVKGKLGRVVAPDDVENIKVIPSDPTCPFCWELPESVKGFTWHQTVDCPFCGERLAHPDTAGSTDRMKHETLHWEETPSNAKNKRRLSVADYICSEAPLWHDIYIGDEIHQYKAEDTAQGEQCGRIAQRSKKILAMTGTFMGGKASEMFYLFQRFGADIHPDYAWKDEAAYIEKFGRYKYVMKATGDSSLRVGVHSRRRSGQTTRKEEIVGYHPEVMKYILPNSLFIRREDILPPPLDEPQMCERCEYDFTYGKDKICWRCRMNPRYHNILIDMDDTEKFEVILSDDDGEQTVEMTHWQTYKMLEGVHYAVAKACLVEKNSIAAFAELRQNLMTWPENCWQGTVVHEPLTTPRNSRILFEMGPTSEDFEYPKEAELLKLVKKEMAEGRKCLVYCTHTQRRSTVERVERILKEQNIRVAVMRITDPRERLEWLRRISKTTDVVIVNPKSVETGLNLQEYPTMIWYEINESMYVTDQASARSARINQDQEVRVFFLAYRNTLQHIMLTLIASKADTARRIYGELGATGLSALNPDDTDLKQIIERQLYEAVRKGTEDEGVNWGDLFDTDIDLNASYGASGPPLTDTGLIAFEIPDEEPEEEEWSIPTTTDSPKPTTNISAPISETISLPAEEMESADNLSTTLEVSLPSSELPELSTPPAALTEIPNKLELGEMEKTPDQSTPPAPEPVPAHLKKEQMGILAQMGLKQKKQVDQGQMVML